MVCTLLIGVSIVRFFYEYAISRKVGLDGWEFYIPLYALWKRVEVVTGNGKRCLWVLLGLIPVIGYAIAAGLLLIWQIKFSMVLAEKYNRKWFPILILGFIYLAPSVFRDAPNCDDEVNKFITRLFKIGGDYAESEPAM